MLLPTRSPGRWLGRLGAAGLCAGLLACGGGSDPAPTPAGEKAVALSSTQSGELLEYARTKLRARLAQRQANPGYAVPSLATTTTESMTSTTVAADVAPRSGTTVQEAGVDEADLIKSDGQVLYTVTSVRDTTTGQSTPRLKAHRRLLDGKLAVSATLDLGAGSQTALNGLQFAESARRLAVLSERMATGGPDPCPAGMLCAATTSLVPYNTVSQVDVQVVDAATDGGLASADHLQISGRLVGTRLIGSTLYVVSTHSPVLAVDALPLDTPATEREAQLARLQTSDLLPTLVRNGAAAGPLVADTDCLVQTGNASTGLDITTITAIDLASTGLTTRSRCIVGGAEALYLSASSLVLATTRWDYTQSTVSTTTTSTTSPAVAVDPLFYPAQFRTDLHKFALEAGSVTYRGSGSVDGHLGWDTGRKAYRISEHQGDLRVLTFTGEQGWGALTDTSRVAASPATLTVLRENPADKTLQVLSRLPNAQRPAALGHAGEQIHGVRFLGERAYLVTFRQTDPLYVLDLSNPADPKVAGELVMPGFSDGLFPLDNGLLLGVGKQASAEGFTGGVKVALFDVQDATNPRELAVRTFGERGSASGIDVSSHGINLLQIGPVVRIALPMALYGPGYTLQQQGLQRFEVDTAARTLAVKSMLPTSEAATGTDPWAYDLWLQRSLQIGSQVYYLSQGTLAAWDW